MKAAILFLFTFGSLLAQDIDPNLTWQERALIKHKMQLHAQRNAGIEEAAQKREEARRAQELAVKQAKALEEERRTEKLEELKVLLAVVAAQQAYRGTDTAGKIQNLEYENERLRFEKMHPPIKARPLQPFP